MPKSPSKVGADRLPTSFSSLLDRTSKDDCALLLASLSSPQDRSCLLVPHRSLDVRALKQGPPERALVRALLPTSFSFSNSHVPSIKEAAIASLARIR